MAQKYQLNLSFPLRGLDKKYAFQDQAPYTTPDALNVRPTDTILERERGGSRPGIDKAYSTLLGSGNPVRLLDDVTFISEDGFTEFIDTFEGTSFGSSWNQIGSDALPGIVDNLVNVAFNSDGKAALDLISNFDTSQAYTTEVFIVPHQGSHHGTYQLYGMLDDTTPVPTTDGFVAQIVMNDATGVATATLTKYAGSSPSAIDTGTGTGTYAKAGWFSVTVSGTTVTMYWDGEQLATGTVSGLSGTRVGFGLECTESGGICLISQYRTQYYETSPNERRKNVLVASSNGVLYKDSTSQTMATISTSLTLASDRLLLSAERAQKLYIADVGLRVDGTDGTISSTTFDDVAGKDWTTYSIDTDDDVVVLSNVTGATVAGVYTIASFDATNITLGSAPGDGTAAFRIERGTKVYDPSDDSLALWTATASKGQIPQSQPLIVRYRDRLVLGGGAEAPHVWYMSRAGDPLDWDYSQEDASAAVAGTNADAGTMGEPIFAMISHSDDYLVFGCQNSMWVLRGDPKFGGMLDNLSENVGVVDKQAWCYGPEGQILFLSRDGLYGLSPGAQQYPQSISREVLPKALRDISSSTFTVTMAYDLRDRGVHIYLSSANVQTVEHFWFDWEQKSFWPVTLEGNYDPTALTVFYSPDLRQTVVLLGSRDGFLRRYDNFFETDGGNQFSSYVTYGPIRLGGRNLNDGIITELVGTLGVDSGNVTWSVLVNDTPEGVSTASAFETGTWVAGLNYNNHPRARGAAFILKVANAESRRWAMESAHAAVKKTGTTRKS